MGFEPALAGRMGVRLGGCVKSACDERRHGRERAWQERSLEHTGKVKCVAEYIGIIARS